MTSDGQRELPFSHFSYYPTNEPINHQTVPLPNYPRFSSLQYWNGHPNVVTSTLPSAADTATPYYPYSHVTPEASAAGYLYGPNTGIPQVNPPSSAQSLSISNTSPPRHGSGHDVGSTIHSMYLPEYDFRLPLLADIGPEWDGPEAFEQEFHQELTATRNLGATAPSSSTPAPTTALSNTGAVELYSFRPPVEGFRTNGGENSTHNQVDKYLTPTSSAVTRKRKQASGPSKVAGRPLKRQNGVGDRATPDVQKGALMNNATRADHSLLRQSGSSHVTTPPTVAGFQRLELTKNIHYTQQTNGGELFRNPRNFTINGSTMNAIEVQQVYVQGSPSNDPALQWLKGYAMKGAEYDSGDRDPPPRCHPGTRTTITQKVQGWLENSEREKNLLWLRGTAGAGKSAIVQTVAESLSGTGRLGASLFFSGPNGRSNPRQIFPTLAYRFAVQDSSYREYIVQLMHADPDSLDKGMSEQFRFLIVEPFVCQGIRSGKAAWAVTLDGLDECGKDPNGRRHSDDVQRDVVRLISSFVQQNLTTPLIWIIASRPEVHLKAVFSEPDVVPSFWEEDVPVDSTEACEDVEKFLHKEFTEIGRKHPEHILDSPWPTHKQFLKIANAALGLFIFAEVVVRFIDDPEVGNPIAQLKCLLVAISKMRSHNQQNPLANLDVIYLAILQKIPSINLQTTKHLLAFLMRVKDNFKISECNFGIMCKVLNISTDIGVTALRHLHSVLYFPKVKNLGTTRPRFYHASFLDFLEDESRSQEYFIDTRAFTLDQFSPNLVHVAQAEFSSDSGLPLPSSPTTEQPLVSLFVGGVIFGEFSSDGVHLNFGETLQWVTKFLPDAQIQPLLESLNALKFVKYLEHNFQWNLKEGNERELSRRGFLCCTTLRSLGIDWGTVSVSISKLGYFQHAQVDTTLGIQTEPHEDSPDVQDFRRRSKVAASDTKVRVFGHRKSGCRVAVVHLEYHGYALTGIPSVTT